MSIQIKSLSTGDAPIKDTVTGATPDTFNVIPEKDVVYTLYLAASQKTAIVKSIRIANTDLTATVKVSLYFSRPNAMDQNQRRALTPPELQLPAGFTYIDDGEITLESGDSIQAICDAGGVIQYIISGVERDVT